MYADTCTSLDLLAGELYEYQWNTLFVATNCMKISTT